MTNNLFGTRGRTAIRVVAVSVIAAGAVVALRPSLVGGQGLPSCGGNARIVPAPYTCTKTRVIDGTAFTVVIDATAGGVATVTYTLDAPRAADTPIRVRWHVGISSGVLASETDGVIPAGSIGPIALSVTSNDCGGQIDTKAVFTGNGDARGRVVAPYVSVPACTTTSTTTTIATTTIATTTTTPTTSPSTSPTTTPNTSTTVATSTPTTPPANVSQQGALPVTGGGFGGPGAAGLLAVAAGVVLVAVTRRRTPELP